MLRDLIVFGEDWGALPSSTQHLISQLSCSRKIVWINSIGLRRPIICKHDLQRAWYKLMAPRQGSQSQTTCLPGGGFSIVNPRTFPVPRTKLARKIAVHLLKRQIKPFVKKAELNNPILWSSLPTAVDMVDQLNTSSTVYYCGDDFSSLAGVDHNIVEKRERELAEKADLIITASNKLADRFPYKKTKLLTHGVDFKHFSTPTTRARDLPNDGRPIAGFYGSLSNWLDIKLLETTIAKMPRWHFVFIGKPSVNISSLNKWHNTHFLGEKPHHELPAYSQHWTASLLPFINNAQIQACNPLKLREYLATGRPVVSTLFPAVEPFKPYVHCVTNSNEMVVALDESARTQTSKKQQRLVIKESWAAKAQLLSQWLEEL